MIEEHLQEAIARFNARAANDEKMRTELAGLKRTVLMELDDGRSYHFRISDGRAGELIEGPAEDAEIVISSSEKTIEAIYRGDMRIMKAIALKKIRIRASLEDMLRLRKFF